FYALSLRDALPIYIRDESRIEVGVDRHLLARHGVEGEAGADLGDALGTLRDDDELDDDEDEEDDRADDERAADGDVPERLDDLAGVAVTEHEAGGCHVEAEAEERRDEQ